jgi:hypothetical protein
MPGVYGNPRLGSARTGVRPGVRGVTADTNKGSTNQGSTNQGSAS